MAKVDRIEAAMAMAEAQTGIRSKSRLRICVNTGKAPAARRWTPEEDEFLRNNLGQITEKEIAKILRRTPTAVHIRRERELHLVAPTKSMDTLTAEQVAIGLCEDGKSVHLLIDRGIMPGRKLPTNGRVIRLLDRVAFVRWILNTDNWAYIHPERIGELRPRGKRRMPQGYDFQFWDELREMVLNRQRKWKDEWLTPGQVRKILNLPCGSRYVNAAIHRGNLPATRWGNWRIRRSSLRKGMTINFRGQWVKKEEDKSCHRKHGTSRTFQS